MFGLAIAAGNFNTYVHYGPAPVVCQRTSVSEGATLPCFGWSGTGGVESMFFITSRQGYPLFTIQQSAIVAAHDVGTPYADLMKEVKTGFGRTMSHLPAAFGVSRQTLYNWLNGETPKEQHQDKLVQLAAAARAFTEAGFKPTALSLERTVAQGKSFVELIGQGADGKEMAKRLIRIEKRGAAAREELDVLLGNRTPLRPDAADMGRPALNENV